LQEKMIGACSVDQRHGNVSCFLWQFWCGGFDPHHFLFDASNFIYQPPALWILLNAPVVHGTVCRQISKR